MKRAAHVRHAHVTWNASIFLWFFLLLLFDRRFIRRGGFLVLRRGGWGLLLLLLLRRSLQRWHGIPVPFGAPSPLLRLHGVIPSPLLAVPRLLFLQLLPVRQITPGRVQWRVVRRVLRLVRPRVLRRILRHWRQLRGHSL